MASPASMEIDEDIKQHIKQEVNDEIIEGLDNFDPSPAKTDTREPPRPFPWQAILEGPAPPYDTIHVKERTLEVAYKHASAIASLIKAKLAGIQSTVPDEANIIGATYLEVCELKRWVDEFESCLKEDQEFEVKVGVAGATGAGKTSLLNALLGYRDLLPSSEEEAATAVVNEIAYNHSDKYAFRAVAQFQTEKELYTEISRFLDIYSNLRKLYGDSPVDEESEAEREGMESLKTGLEKIKLVWGLSENDLSTMTAQKMMSLDPRVLAVLGRKEEITDQNENEFSAKIKPYLSSSSIQSNSQDGESRSFPAWPLLKKVKLYVKSDLLRTGITLVDLPGVGDILQSRAQVAKRAFGELTVTIIVAPACRAADEQYSATLLSENQELQMKMDGSFNANRFCFCLSKIDDMDCNTFLRDEKNAELKVLLQPDRQRMDELSQDCNNLKEEISETKRKKESSIRHRYKMTRQIQRSKKEVGEPVLTSQSTTNQARFERKLNILRQTAEDCDNKLSEYESKERKSRDEYNYLDSRVKFACVSARSENITKRLRGDFEKRLTGVKMPNRRSLDDGQTLSVFPTCSRAFWLASRDHNAANPMPGFPSQDYAGIPGLEGFIFRSSVESRSRHIATQLYRYLNLLNRLVRWTEVRNKDQIVVSRRQLHDEILDKQYRNLEQQMLGVFGDIDSEVNRINPTELNSRQAAKAAKECGQKAVDLVSGWEFIKLSGDMGGLKPRVPYRTYNALVVRRGARYKSTGRIKMEFSWMEDLTRIFLEHFIGHWRKAMDEDIPAVAGKLGNELRALFKSWYCKTMKMIIQAQPRLREYLEEDMEKVITISETVTNNAQRPLDQISNATPEVIERLQKSLEDTMELPFKKAIKVKAGKGRYKRIIDMLVKETLKKKGKLYKEASSELAKYLAEIKETLPTKHADVAHEGRILVRSQINALLSNVTRVEESDLSEQERQLYQLVIELKDQTREFVLTWDSDWRSKDQESPNPNPDQDIGYKQQIPKWFPTVEELAKRYDGGDSDDSSSFEMDMDLDDSEEGNDKVAGEAEREYTSASFAPTNSINASRPEASGEEVMDVSGAKVQEEVGGKGGEIPEHIGVDATRKEVPGRDPQQSGSGSGENSAAAEAVE